MTRDRMMEMLCENMGATAEEARAALETRNWDLLDAARLLQQRARAKRLEAARASRQSDGGLLRDVISWFVARRAAPAEIPLRADALTPLFLMSSVYAYR